MLGYFAQRSELIVWCFRFIGTQEEPGGEYFRQQAVLIDYYHCGSCILQHQSFHYRILQARRALDVFWPFWMTPRRLV